MYTITLANGTKLKNLELNGNNYIAQKVIEDSVFEGNLSTVTVSDGEKTETFTNTTLIQNKDMGGKSWFILDVTPAREKSFEDSMAVATIMFVLEAQSENSRLDDTTLTEHTDLFPVWDANWRGKAGGIVSDGGKLFRSIHDVNDAGQNTKPGKTPSMWTPIGDPGEEWPEWSQPLGAHDAYSIDAKVNFADRHWVSTLNGNVWQPGTYGWEEAV